MTEPATVPHHAEVTRVIAASPAALYAAWTDPEQLRRWFATVVDADVRVGGRYHIEVHEDDGSVNGFGGVYLGLVPGERVAFTFTHDGETPADRISDERVEVTFSEVEPGRTAVTVANSWVGPSCEPADYTRLREGWGEWLAQLEKAYT